MRTSHQTRKLTPHVSVIDAHIASQMSVHRLRTSWLGYDQIWPLQEEYAHVESSAGQFAQIVPLRIGGHAWDPTYLSGNGLHWHSIRDRMHAERYIEMQRGYIFDEHLVVCEYSMYCIV